MMSMPLTTALHSTRWWYCDQISHFYKLHDKKNGLRKRICSTLGFRILNIFPIFIGKCWTGHQTGCQRYPFIIWRRAIIFHSFIYHGPMGSNGVAFSMSRWIWCLHGGWFTKQMVLSTYFGYLICKINWGHSLQ